MVKKRKGKGHLMRKKIENEAKYHQKKLLEAEALGFPGRAQTFLVMVACSFSLLCKNLRGEIACGSESTLEKLPWDNALFKSIRQNVQPEPELELPSPEQLAMGH